MKPKPKGKGLDIRTFEGTKDGSTYLVFRTPRGSYHVFPEVNARDAARESFGMPSANTQKMWDSLWNSIKPLSYVSAKPRKAHSFADTEGRLWRLYREDVMSLARSEKNWEHTIRLTDGRIVDANERFEVMQACLYRR